MTDIYDTFYEEIERLRAINAEQATKIAAQQEVIQQLQNDLKAKANRMLNAMKVLNGTVGFIELKPHDYEEVLAR